MQLGLNTGNSHNLQGILANSPLFWEKCLQVLSTCALVCVRLQTVVFSLSTIHLEILSTTQHMNKIFFMTNKKKG